MNHAVIKPVQSYQILTSRLIFSSSRGRFAYEQRKQKESNEQETKISCPNLERFFCQQTIILLKIPCFMFEVLIVKEFVVNIKQVVQFPCNQVCTHTHTACDMTQEEQTPKPKYLRFVLFAPSLLIPTNCINLLLHKQCTILIWGSARRDHLNTARRKLNKLRRKKNLLAITKKYIWFGAVLFIVFSFFMFNEIFVFSVTEW